MSLSLLTILPAVSAREAAVQTAWQVNWDAAMCLQIFIWPELPSIFGKNLAFPEIAVQEPSFFPVAIWAVFSVRTT